MSECCRLSKNTHSKPSVSNDHEVLVSQPTQTACEPAHIKEIVVTTAAGAATGGASVPPVPTYLSASRSRSPFRYVCSPLIRSLNEASSAGGSILKASSASSSRRLSFSVSIFRRVNGPRHQRLANVSHQNRRSQKWDTERVFSTLNQRALKRLAIPAGIAPPRNFNSLPQVRHQNESTETKRFWNKCLTFLGGFPARSWGRARAVLLGDCRPLASALQ